MRSPHQLGVLGEVLAGESAILKVELERYKRAVNKAQVYLSLISMTSGSLKISELADNGINEINSILNP